MWLAWIDDNGEAHAEDLFSPAMANGCSEYGFCNWRDAAQGGRDDVALRFGWRNASGSGVAWRRALDTGDRLDTPIVKGETHIMWAVGGERTLHALADANAVHNIHCYDCASPFYAGCTAACPLQGKNGYLARSTSTWVPFFNGYKSKLYARVRFFLIYCGKLFISFLLFWCRRIA